MHQSVRILHLEDDAADAELVEAILESAGMVCRITRVQTGDAFGEALRQSEYDIILADFRLPNYDGMSALRLAQQLARDVPFIFVSGTMGEDAAIEGLTEGATDYVLKDKLARLEPAVKRALRDADNRQERKRAEEALRESEQMLKLVLDTIPARVFWKNLDSNYLGCNRPFALDAGLQTPEEIIARNDFEMGWAEQAELYRSDDRLVMETGSPKLGYEEPQTTPDGGRIWLRTNKIPLLDTEGRIKGVLGTYEDITESKQLEEALRTSEIKYRIVADNTYDWEYWVSPEGRFLYTSPSCQRVTGYTVSEFETDSTLLFCIVHPDDLVQFEAHLEPDQATCEPRGLEFRIIHRDGTTRWIGHLCQPVFDVQGRFLGRRGSNRDITKHKWAEEQLLESEARYRRIVETANEGIAEMDGHFRLTFVNPRICETLGYTSEEALGRPVTDFMVQEDLPALRVKMEERMAGHRGQYEWRVRCKDGRIRWTGVSATPIKNEAGQFVGSFAMFTDITERKQAEQKLEESERKYRKLHESMMDGFVYVDMTGKITGFNESYRQMLGYTNEELLQLTYVYLTPERWHVFEQGIVEDQVLLKGYSEVYEKEYRKKDGTVFPVELRTFLIKDESSGNQGMWAIVRDITKRKWAEEALQQSELRYRNLVESSHDWVWEVDQNGVYTFASPQCRELLGYEPEELIGKKPFDLMPPDEARRVEETFASIAAQRKPFRVLVNANRHKDGRIVLLETNGVPVLDEEGNLRGYRGMDRDITKLKQAEAERIELERQLQQTLKAESLGRMAGAIAHHFNNQLGAVMGNLELAMINLPSGSEVQASLAEAMKASHRASEVSALMLTYLGQTPGKREPLDLSEVCRRSLPMLQAIIPKDVVMDHNLPSPGPTVSANANQIQQVLTNLITNAWEAVGDDQGAIHLTLKTVSSVEIPAAHRFPIDWQPQDNAYACLEVMDTDYGISDKDMEKIFDPFFSTKFTGRGLGLSVVLGIVRAHGGVVTVESEPGRGSVFRIFFPMSAEGVPCQLDKVAKTPEMEEGGTVLLVEDEEMMRNMAAAMLTHLGFAVLAAKDGVDAVEVFRQHEDEIRCVLCDLTMPRINGWETVAALRALRPEVPVILASGYVEAKVMEGKHAELPQAFLQKPYRLLELKAALGAAMGASSAESMKGD